VKTAPILKKTPQPMQPLTKQGGMPSRSVRFSGYGTRAVKSALEQVLAAGKQKPSVADLKWGDNLAIPSLLGDIPESISHLPGAQQAWATMTYARAPGTFKRHNLWWDRWQGYCEIQLNTEI